MQTYGLQWVGYKSGRPAPVIRKYKFADTETLTKGDALNRDASGYVDLFATGGDTGFIGVANETVSGTTTVTEIEVILDLDGDARWAIYDANARVEGAELDLSGSTGAMTLATDGDSDVIVAANSTATEPTIVRSHPRARGVAIT